MIETRVDNARALAALGRLANATVRRAPLMRELAGIMADAVEENFAQEGRPKWQGLAPRTRKRRPDGMILQGSGRLAGSIVQTSDANAAAVGTNVKYAAIHNFGGTINYAPRSGVTRLRTNARGELLRQGHDKRLAIFAKDGHKRVRAVRWTNPTGWSVVMPRREFLAATEGDVERMEEVVERYLRTVVEK